MKTAWDIGETSGVGIGFGRSGDGKDLVLQHKQDNEPFLRANAAERNSRDSFQLGGENFTKAFSLSPIFAMGLKMNYGLDVNKPDDREEVIKLLSGPDFKKWRTAEGNFTKRPERQHFAAGRRRQRSRIVKLGSLSEPGGRYDIGTRGMFS